jgi:hypothetical protein
MQAKISKTAEKMEFLKIKFTKLPGAFLAFRFLALSW